MKNDAPLGQNDLSPLHLLHRAGQIADVLFNKEVGNTDLTPRQFAVLSCVANNADLSQADIVAKTGIDRSTLADVVRRLSRQGLLERQRTREDARRYAVRLTAQGETALAATKPAALSADEHILSALRPEERTQFLQLLNQIVETMDSRVRAQSTGDKGSTADKSDAKSATAA